MRVTVIIGLILVVGVSFSGCANVTHSVRIDTDKSDGYAVGSYHDDRYGQMGGWGFWVLGGYAGDTNSAWPWNAKQGYSDPVGFARAVAMINYSKRLKNISYNESGQIVGYTFDNKLSARNTGYQEIPGQPSLPSSFGHQPIE